MKKYYFLGLSFLSVSGFYAAQNKPEGRQIMVQYNKQQAFVFAETWTDWSDFAQKAYKIFKPEEDHDWAVAKVRDQSEEGQMCGLITQEQLDELNCHLELVPFRFPPIKSAGKLE